jgi:hypothetical protein
LRRRTRWTCVFNQLARKSAFCEYLNQMEANLRLGPKAQAQCRATLQTLAEIRNPRPIAFVKQTNIANGPQQVNNGSAAPQPRAHARENSENPANELLTGDHGTALDSRATEPTTDAGKSASSHNAIKHGVYSAQQPEERRCVHDLHRDLRGRTFGKI